VEVDFPTGKNFLGLYHDYNYKQRNTRIVVEQAFGRFKDVWRILHCLIWNYDEKINSKIDLILLLFIQHHVKK
jgi:hypothetical protein